MASNRFSVYSGYRPSGRDLIRRYGYSPYEVESRIAHYDEAANADAEVEVGLRDNGNGVRGHVHVKIGGKEINISIKDGKIAGVGWDPELVQ